VIQSFDDATRTKAAASLFHALPSSRIRYCPIHSAASPGENPHDCPPSEEVGARSNPILISMRAYATATTNTKKKDKQQQQKQAASAPANPKSDLHVKQKLCRRFAKKKVWAVVGDGLLQEFEFRSDDPLGHPSYVTTYPHGEEDEEQEEMKEAFYEMYGKKKERKIAKKLAARQAAKEAVSHAQT